MLRPILTATLAVSLMALPALAEIELKIVKKQLLQVCILAQKI